MTPDCAADVWHVLWKVWVLRGVVVRLWGAAGGVGDRRVLSGDIFMYCRGMFWTATTKHNISWSSHQGKRREECLRGQSINSMQLQVQSHCTQSATIPPLSGGADKSSSPETKGRLTVLYLLTSSSVSSRIVFCLKPTVYLLRIILFYLIYQQII